MSKQKNYTIGLDIGTNSVGWAVLDDEFNLVQGKKKITEIDADGHKTTRKVRTNLWGARLFSEAETAVGRRQKRGMRRRIARRKQRLGYLRGIFEGEILKFDDSFFIRMDESFLQFDDKKAKEYSYIDENGKRQESGPIEREKVRYPLFNGKLGEGETYESDQGYYKNYPTIYHLRQRLVEDDSQADLRLVYLALHHIAKFRGHFTNQGQKFDLKNINVGDSLIELFDAFKEATRESGSFEWEFDDNCKERANTILKDRKKSKSRKAEELTQLYSVVGRENNFEIYDKGTSKKTETYLKSVDAQQKALYSAIVGNGIDVAKIFGKEEYKSSDDNKFYKAGDFKYSNENFEDKLAEIENDISSEEISVLLMGKKVYEAVVLCNILTKDTLAASMVDKYDNHKKQLLQLKKFIKEYLPDEYRKMFYDEPRLIKSGNGPAQTEGTYVGYVGRIDRNNKTSKKDFSKFATREQFYKYVKELFFKLLDNEINQKKIIFEDAKKLTNSGQSANFNYEFMQSNKENSAEEMRKFTPEIFQFVLEVLKDMEFDSYLLKQRQSDNGAIPYQVHEYELEAILKNQGQYYDFLSETLELENENEEGEIIKKTEYKIQALFKFRIPYYVGTLAKEAGWIRNEEGKLEKVEDSKAKNSWIVRKSDEKLTPWNFNSVVDKEKSAINFIERMTNFDTYLPEEKVLPKNSLLYQEFTVYNELIICGYYNKGKKEYFSSELRKEIVDDLFKKHKKVSAKKMIEYLNTKQKNNIVSSKELFGIDTFVKSPGYNTSLSTYIDFVGMGFSGEMIEVHQSFFEQIIKWQTIFEDKKILKKTIRNANENEWNHLFTDEQVTKLSKKHYTGWGRMSKRLLDGIRAENGKTIIDNLKTENFRNFMRLLEDKQISEKIRKAQVTLIDENELNYEMVSELAGSPALKRGIWQSMQIIKELESYLGRDSIDKIVVEMARDNQSGRTKKRVNQIEAFYKKFIEKTKENIDDVYGYFERDFNNTRREFESSKDHINFDNERFFLYFLQNGRCMYSGAELDLDSLKEYEVDHIIPQTYIKDDSFDNKVLVKKEENQNKGGDVPSQQIINRMRDFWELLAKNGQISPKKLANLTAGKLTDKIKKGFINRQLVETRQITKHVANILSSYFKNTDIKVLTPKAGLTSQFRKGEVFVSKDEFDFDKAMYEGIHFEYENKEFLENGEVLESGYNNSNFVKVHFHEGFLKNRDLNNYHHAHDAYLNGVIALYVYETRPDLSNMWVYGEYQKKAEREIGKYGKQRQNYFKQLLTDMQNDKWIKYVVDADNKELLHESGDFWIRDEVLGRIRRNLSLRNVNIVRKTEILTGKFGDETVYKADKKAENFAMGMKKRYNPLLYGGTKAPVSAFSVIALNAKNEVVTVSVPAMGTDIYDKYLQKGEGLKYANEIYSKDKIVKILVDKVPKYTKYILPNSGVRLLASYQEAQSGIELPMMKVVDRNSSESELDDIFNKLSEFIIKNELFVEAKQILLETKIKEYFTSCEREIQLRVIAELLGVANGKNQNLKALQGAGLGTTAQQLKNGNLITGGTIIINQSATGLMEVRKKLPE